MKFMSVLVIVVLPYLSFADTTKISMDDKPSFDCSKTKTSIEEMICDSKELSKLDKLLSVSYHDALSKGNKQSIKEWQRVWLNNDRGICNDAQCLKKVYESQVSKLRAFGSNMSKKSISGEYQRYYNGKPDKDTSSIDIIELNSNRVQIVGSSMWIGNIETGDVNTGEIYGISTLVGNKLNYTDQEVTDCKLTLTFDENALIVRGDNSKCGGINVSPPLHAGNPVV